MIRRTDASGVLPCIMFYHKDGCPKHKSGQKCYWSHDVKFTNAEKNSMAMIAEKRVQQEKELKTANGKGRSDRQGPKGADPAGDGKKPKGGKRGSSRPPKKSDQPCRSWEKDGTCAFGDTCRYAHAEKTRALGGGRTLQLLSPLLAPVRPSPLTI